MKMIPSQPYETDSMAELCVFDQLRSAFNRPDQNAWFALHSLNLPRHEKKRFGEIDFIVCGPGGLYVIEVKGGGVSCHNGNWETINRKGESHQLRESPFRQAEKALHGLLSKLPTSLSEKIIVGYGVILPDVDRLPKSAEWDRAVLADGRDFKDFDKWLERFIRHWREKNIKDTKRGKTTTSQLRELQQFMRPEFEAVVPLHVAVNEVESRIARLTEDQLKFIDVVEDNERVICSGGAGTGKTMLAINLAKRWCASGKKTVLACYSPWLKH